jgi:uncharacterized protein
MNLEVTTRSTNPKRLLGLLVFFMIAFGVPWSAWISLAFVAKPTELQSLLAFAVLPGAVSFAAIAAKFIEGGKSAVTAFMRITVFQRFSPLVLGLVLALPLIAGFLTFLPHPNHLLGQGTPDPMIWIGAITLMNLWTGPLAEEFGWRGYLLTFLEQRFSTILAGFLIGPIWALWHVPLFWGSVFSQVESATGYLLWVCAWSVMLAIITSLAKGNLIPAVLLHLVMNTQADLFSALLPSLDGEHLPSGLSMALASIATAVVTAWWFAHRQHQQGRNWPRALRTGRNPHGD